MAKERDWVDYTNLGSNLFQNLQLSGVNDKLRAMASLAQREQAAAEMENRARELVFQADTGLMKMRSSPTENKARRLIVIRQLQANFKRGGLTSEVFRAYEDKTRLRTVLDGYEALAREYSRDLSQSEREEAELCAKYKAEESDLSARIDLLVSRDELGSAREELRALEKKTRVSSALQIIGGILILYGIGWGLMSCSEQTGKNEAALEGAFLVFFVGAITGGIGKALPSSVNAESQRKKVKELESSSISLPEVHFAASGQTNFGTDSLGELRRMQSERNALIAKVFGDGQEDVGPVGN